MKRCTYLVVERLICTCWIVSHDWSWKVPVWWGRADDGWLSHSLGSLAYGFESRILCSRLMGWLGT